ncbi:MAG: Mur ligase family protein, partial [Myxococcota bacterium]
DTAFFDKVPKFVHYRPRTAILTSIEFDHADIYDSVETIEQQFVKLVELIPNTGTILAAADDQRVMRVVENTEADVERYALEESPNTRWHVRDLSFSADGAHFSIFQHRIRLGRFHLPMSGRYNVANAIAATVVALRLGMSVAEIRDAMAEFKGIARRQTVRAEINGIRVIDDFAHHPTAVRQTIDGIRDRYDKGRLFAIFEPRTATSSRNYFQDAYASAFGNADEVIIAAVGRKELPESERLDTAALADAISAGGTRARNVPKVEDIVAMLAEEAKPQDTLLFMSNGGFGGIHNKMIETLQQQS